MVWFPALFLGAVLGDDGVGLANLSPDLGWVGIWRPVGVSSPPPPESLLFLAVVVYVCTSDIAKFKIGVAITCRRAAMGVM